MELDGAIKTLFPNAVNGIDYVLQDDGKGPYIKRWNLPDPKPTQTELVQAEKAYVAKRTATAYKKKRRKEYPPVEDQLDALWKALEAAGLVTEDPAQPENDPRGMLAKIKAIKAKYPKPL